jgi:hypothetical protein
MVELKDEEDGRVALIMDKGELPQCHVEERDRC